MSTGRVAAWAVVVLVIVSGIAAALIYVPGWLARTREPAAAPEAPPPAASRHIKATLFYVSQDGLRLVPAEREVPFGDGLVQQARHLVEVQLQPPAAPIVSAVPPGTRLRAIYVSERGEAFVDLSPEVSASHPGGALNELLTVYTIVNALTTNLPALTAVQILVNGREVDTLAGHVDLRRPLAGNTALIQAATGAAAPVATGDAPADAAPAAPAAPATPASTIR